jgi:hypothetical protein
MCVHFVNFRGDEYHRAVKVFGKPDFFHRCWDARAIQEVADGDTVVFAKGKIEDGPCQYAFNDSNVF